MPVSTHAVILVTPNLVHPKAKILLVYQSAKPVRVEPIPRRELRSYSLFLNMVLEADG